MSRAKTESQPPTGDEPKHKWRCPAGHTSWERINSHVWCHACSRELQGADAADVDPEWTSSRTRRPASANQSSTSSNDVWPDYNEVSAY